MRKIGRGRRREIRSTTFPSSLTGPVSIQYIYSMAVSLPLLASMRSLSYADDLARAVLSERPMGWKGKKNHFISQSFAKMLAVLANLMANGLNDTGSV